MGKSPVTSFAMNIMLKVSNFSHSLSLPFKGSSDSYPLLYRKVLGQLTKSPCLKSLWQPLRFVP